MQKYLGIGQELIRCKLVKKKKVWDYHFWYSQQKFTECPFCIWIMFLGTRGVIVSKKAWFPYLIHTLQYIIMNFDKSDEEKYRYE